MKFVRYKQVRFHHCDPAGIVFYPQFYVLLHEMQEDFLAHIGFPEHALIRSGYGVPIVDMKTEFLGMCRHGDVLTLTLELSKIGNASLGMVYEICGQAQAPDVALPVRVRAHGVVVLTQLSESKPVRLPDGLRAALLPYLTPFPEVQP